MNGLPDNDQPLTAEMARAMAGNIIHKYFTTQNIPLTKHHIDSYDQFIQRDFKNIVAAANPLILLKNEFGSSGIYRYKVEIFIGGIAADAIKVGLPTIKLNNEKDVRVLYPNEARLRNLTYALPISADITYRITTRANEKDAEPTVFEETIADYPLCSMPLMLHSRFCPLHGQPQSILKQMGECPEDGGGYFIIEGSEKVLITKQEGAFNTLYISEQKRDNKVHYYGTIQSLDPVSRYITRSSFFWSREREVMGLFGSEESTLYPSVLEVKIPMVTKPIPVFILFRALGIQTDRDIVRLIFPDMDNPETAYMADLLGPSINAAQPIVDSYTALTYIKQFTKGLSEIRIIDILQNDFFCHIEKGNYSAKAAYLADCVRSILRVVKKLDPPTDKDDIRNQRLLTSGFLTQTKFQEIYSSWLRAVSKALDEEYAYHSQQYQGENFKTLFDAGNRAAMFRSGFINDGLMRAFKGKFGSEKVGGGDEAVGVLQALSRISYLDFMSHCRRVVLEFDMGLKLPGPRRLHPSQYGYFCTSETPTGSHIGITKNLSIFTAISNGMIPTKFVQMLYKRGFVIPTTDVTPRLIVNMVPVYVNKAIVGYNETPELFVEFLKALKGTGCLPPYSSCGFNRKGRFIFLYTDEGRPLRPLYRAGAVAGSGAMTTVKNATSWRDLVIGSLQETAHVQLPSTQFIDVFAEGEPASLQNYIDRLKPHMGLVEYIDPYEHNECYVANQPEDMKPETTHMEIHASTILGLLGVMIPYANHNQSPRNQLSGSQSKQGLGMYATNWYNRYDNNAHVLCYGEAPLSRTLYQDYIGSGRMSYGHNIILALDICTGYNQEDGILINKTALERGLFRNMSYRSYEAYEEDDPRAKSKTRIGNPHNVPAWLDVNISTDYSKLDANGIVKPGSYVDENTAIVGRYIQLENGTIKDASVKPQVWTSGRVEDVVVMVGNNGLRLVKIRVVHDRSPELGDKFCLTADHDVLTDEGWVQITDINHGHHVAVYDEETRELFYQPPEEVVGFAHKTGEIYEFTMLGDYVLKVTADHRLYVSLDDDKTWGFATAKEVARQHKRIYMMAENKAVYQVKSIDIYEGNPYSETVHCLKVSTGIFVARAHGSAVGFLTGNSNRHGQKGTIGMMLRGRDMPRTVDGIVPDMIMNPHAIPSRMTIAQLLEQMLGKVAASLGAIGNATPFMNEGSPHEVLGQILEDLGMERTGNEILYDGQSGKQIEAAIFIGPLYSMRLKHMTEDKWNARGEGRKEQRTHQPTGGRGAQGGLKIGEMERDAIVAHGIGSFVKESMMERSDAASFVVCNGCGTIPIYNEGQNFYLCSLCEGPVKFVGDRPDNLEPIPPTRRSTVTYSKVEMPYASKLFLQEMDFFMNMGARLLTTKDVERLPAVADIEEETVAEAANIDAELPVRTYTEVYVPELRKEEVTPTIKEIESQVAQIEEQQKKIMEQEAELRRTREALDAGLLGNNVVEVPGQTLQSDVGQTSVQTLPIQQNQTFQTQTLPVNVAPIQPTPMMPTQGMDIIPGEAPTIIVSTTEEDMAREGLGSKPTMPLGQPDVQQYEQPVQPVQRRTVRIRQPRDYAYQQPPMSAQVPAPLAQEPPQPQYSQTPHTGGEEQSYSGSGEFKVIKLG